MRFRWERKSSSCKSIWKFRKCALPTAFSSSVDVPEELFAASVPSLILQPIVENAIKHGIAKEADGGWIRVSAFRSNGQLSLSVYNDGPGLPAEWDNSKSGIGIANLRSRLRAMFGDAFELSLRNQDCRRGSADLRAFPGERKVSARPPHRKAPNARRG